GCMWCLLGSHSPSSACATSPTPPSLLLCLPRPAPTELYTLSLHDALPISGDRVLRRVAVADPDPRIRASAAAAARPGARRAHPRSEEHTSELQSRENLVCRLLLEKKKQPCQGRNRRPRQPPERGGDRPDHA